MNIMNTHTLILTSLGLTGMEYISRLEKKGFQATDWAKGISAKIPASRKGTTYEIALIKGSEFSPPYPTTKEIRAEAVERGYGTPPAEIAYLLREKLSDEEIEAMGLWWIVVMHESLEYSGGDPNLLATFRDDDGRPLNMCIGRSSVGWDRVDGFAFVASKKSR